MVEAHAIAQLRVVREQGAHRRVSAEHVLDQSLECLLRAHLDERSTPRLVQGLEALHELHRGGDLFPEDVDHLSGHVRSHRVELAIDVRNERDCGGGEAQPSELSLQRFARRSDDLGVEGVAHRERNHLSASIGEEASRGLDTGGRAADDRLLEAVHIGDHDVVIDRFHRGFDVFDRGEYGRHCALVRNVDVGHLPASSRDGLEGILEGERVRSNQGSILAEAVPHHHVWADAVGAQQIRQRNVNRQNRRLGDLCLSEFCVGGGHRCLV